MTQYPSERAANSRGSFIYFATSNPRHLRAFAAGISNCKWNLECSHQVAKLALCSSAVRVDGRPKTLSWLVVLLAGSHTWWTIGRGALSISRRGFLTVDSERYRVHWWWPLKVKLPWRGRTVREEVIFLSANWASVWTNHNSGCSVQKGGSFHEKALTGTC